MGNHLEPYAPVGVAAGATLDGWHWIISSASGEVSGTFVGSRRGLIADLRARLPARAVPVYRGFKARSLDDPGGRDYQAHMEAGRDVVKESVRLAERAFRRVREANRAGLLGHVDHLEDAHAPERFGHIACDASVGKERDQGAWAVVSESGWYQTGLILTAPGQLQAVTAELVAVQRAVRLSLHSTGPVEITNDSTLALLVARRLEGGARTREVFAQVPSLLSSPVDGLQQLFTETHARFGSPLSWRSRNSTPALKLADQLSRAVRLGRTAPVAPVLDLRGALPPFRAELPQGVSELIAQAEQAGWTFVETKVHSGKRFVRLVKVERHGVVMVWRWVRGMKGQWFPRWVRYLVDGEEQRLEWDEGLAALV